MAPHNAVRLRAFSDDTCEANHVQRRAGGDLVNRLKQADSAASLVLVVFALSPDDLRDLRGFSAAIWWGDADCGRAYAQVMAARDGEILPLITALPDQAHVSHERHLCVDTTAAGGNASLLAG